MGKRPYMFPHEMGKKVQINFERLKHVKQCVLMYTHFELSWLNFYKYTSNKSSGFLCNLQEPGKNKFFLFNKNNLFVTKKKIVEITQKSFFLPENILKIY